MTENAGKEKEVLLPEIADVKTKEVSLLGGIVPKDFSELTRFASLVHTSRLAPKGFDTVEKVAIGMLTNMELGRPIITGLQDLAIINGRCGIYGDASLAMVTASGLMDEGYPKSEETGTPYQDDWTFKFMVKRIGRPEETGIWTWIDSKKAGFDAPKTKDGRNDIWSPWTRFTRRMMQWKARNFVMRDNFGDVLKGMKTVEDLHDLDAVPLTKGAGGTYSTEEGEASDLTKAIKKKTEVEQKEEKPSTEEKLEKTSVEREATDQEPEKVEETITTDFRSEWIKLKAAGFATYFHKNRESFELAPIEIQEEARAKWLKLYPKTPWPLAFGSEDEELKAVNTEINDYFPMQTVDAAQKNLELPPNRALSLDESNLLLAECQRLTKGRGEDLA